MLHTSTPYHYRDARAGTTEEAYAAALAAELEALIQREGPDTVAAFIAEPVMGAGGVLVPPRTYFDRVQAVLRKHDVLMIADEVICGFGRLGRLFGSEVYGIEPDLVTVAKGLTSGYFPLSAVILSERVWSVLQAGSPEVGAFAHGFTYSGHPVGAAAAMANLDILLGEDMVGNADADRRLPPVEPPGAVQGEPPGGRGARSRSHRRHRARGRPREPAAVRRHAEGRPSKSRPGVSRTG